MVCGGDIFRRVYREPAADAVNDFAFARSGDGIHLDLRIPTDIDALSRVYCDSTRTRPGRLRCQDDSLAPVFHRGEGTFLNAR